MPAAMRQAPVAKSNAACSPLAKGRDQRGEETAAGQDGRLVSEQAGEYRGTDQVPDWAVAQEGGEPGGDRWQAGRRGRRGNSVSHEPVAERRWQRGGQARDARILNNARRNIGSATWCSIRAKAASRATPPLRQPSTNGLVQ